MVGVGLSLFLWHAMKNNLLAPHIPNARGMNVDYRCIFCRIAKLDSRDQIFIPCIFANEVWQVLLFWPKQHGTVRIFRKKSNCILIISREFLLLQLKVRS